LSFISYAQNLEDLMLYRALKHVEQGFYIDVGAQHPVVDSVTKAFYDRGWRGINIEPNSEYYQLLKVGRPEDINIEAAAMDYEGKVVFYEVLHTGLSSINKDYADLQARAGYEIRKRIVPCTSLDAICTMHKVETVHFLNIDAEGAEKAVLDGFAFTGIRPWIVLLEANAPNSTRDVSQMWEATILRKGYKFIYYDGLNRYYLSKEHSDLRSHFKVPPNVFDDYIVYRMWAEGGQASQQELVSERAQKESLSAQLQASQQELASERAQKESLSTQLASERAQKESLSTQLQKVYSSHSWKLTAPLRKGKQVFDFLLSIPIKATLYIIRGILMRYPQVQRAVAWLLKGHPGVNAKLLQLAGIQSHVQIITDDVPVTTTFISSLKEKYWTIRNKLISLSRRRRAKFYTVPEQLKYTSTKGYTIYYWIDHTCWYKANSGIQRVTRSFARGLQETGVKLIPIKWNNTALTFRAAEQLDLLRMAKWNGPDPTRFIVYSIPDNESDAWLIIPELIGEDPKLDLIIKTARSKGLNTAIIFYDAFPSKHTHIYTAERARIHMEYMKQMAGCDCIFPISNASSADLVDFLSKQEDRSVNIESKLIPVLLPGEFHEHPRVTQYKEPTSSTIRILCVSTIEPRKNHLLLLEAFDRISKKALARSELILVGGCMFPDLEKEVHAFMARNSRIHWLKNIDDKDLATEYAKCHFTVYPSLDEGFGLPILESLWYGRPCICRNSSAMVEAAAGGGCLTVDTADVDKLTNAIELLATDVELRTRLGKEAVTRHIKTWSEYTWEILHHLAKRTGGSKG